MLLDFIQLLKYFCVFSRMAFQFQASHHSPVSNVFLLILLWWIWRLCRSWKQCPLLWDLIAFYKKALKYASNYWIFLQNNYLKVPDFLLFNYDFISFHFLSCLLWPALHTYILSPELLWNMFNSIESFLMCIAKSLVKPRGFVCWGKTSHGVSNLLV